MTDIKIIKTKAYSTGEVLLMVASVVNITIGILLRFFADDAGTQANFCMILAVIGLQLVKWDR